MSRVILQSPSRSKNVTKCCTLHIAIVCIFGCHILRCQLIYEDEYHNILFQINQSTRCNNFSSILLDVYTYVQLNMFWVSSRPSSGA
jgi:hypothetical protein